MAATDEAAQRVEEVLERTEGISAYQVTIGNPGGFFARRCRERRRPLLGDPGGCRAGAAMQESLRQPLTALPQIGTIKVEAGESGGFSASRIEVIVRADVASVSTVDGPVQVVRIDSERAVTVSGTATGANIGATTAALSSRLEALNLPAGSRVLLRELHHMSVAGLGDAEALRAATVEAARLLGEADDRGEIAPGKRADLVLLSGNTLDVSDLATRISRVFHNGREPGPLPSEPVQRRDQEAP